MQNGDSMKSIIFSILIFASYSTVFANSHACKTTIKTLYRKYGVEVHLIEEAKSRCEINNIEMQLCLTGEKFFNNDKTPEGIRELFGICDDEIETLTKNVYFN
jgi:hypothetical protein